MISKENYVQKNHKNVDKKILLKFNNVNNNNQVC